MAKRKVVFGFLGNVLDGRTKKDRWEKWRPTVSIFQQPDQVMDRLELLHFRRDLTLAQQTAADIHAVSPETTVNIHPVIIQDPWDFQEVYGWLHDFARGYPFNTDEEEYLIHITTGTHVIQICLFLLAESRHLPGKLLQASPSRDHSLPGEISIIDLDLSRYDRLASRFQQEHQGGVNFLKGGIETRNVAFNRLMDRIEQVASLTVEPILITGPTGAGKSRLAKRIFELKKARHNITGAFVELNCATLRGDGAMSALFGHTKGAFTGALAARAGLLRAADGGVLFLDEIGELGQDEQAMLLRALEEKRFLPLGADREVESSFQLIAGTNRDLWQDVAEGKFREDLLARIHLWTFGLPGLRERREDIAPNLAYELEDFGRRNGRRVEFNKEARQKFLDFAHGPKGVWKANFRDLHGSVVRMATLALGGRITSELVEEELQRLEMAWQSHRNSKQLGQESAIARVLGPSAAAGLDPFDQVQLEEVLRVCLQSRSLSEAGRELFAVSRLKKSSGNDADRLRKYLQRFGLDWGRLEEVVRPGGE